MKFILSIFLITLSIAAAQRPFYAGSKPIGYPELADRFQPIEPETTTAGLGNRFGEDNQTVSTTTIRLPVDALGDKDLVDRISKWPVEKQPYWYINWKIIEAQRQQRPVVQELPAGSQQINGQPQGSQQNFVQPQVSEQRFGQPQGSRSFDLPQGSQNFGQPQGSFGPNQNFGQPQGSFGPQQNFGQPLDQRYRYNQQWQNERRGNNNNWQNWRQDRPLDNNRQ